MDNLVATLLAVAGPVVLLGQAAGEGGFTSTDTLVSGSVLAASVGALVYLVRQFAAGNLVSRSSHEVEERLAVSLDRVTEALERSQERERAYLNLLAPNLPVGKQTETPRHGGG